MMVSQFRIAVIQLFHNQKLSFQTRPPAVVLGPTYIRSLCHVASSSGAACLKSQGQARPRKPESLQKGPVCLQRRAENDASWRVIFNHPRPFHTLFIILPCQHHTCGLFWLGSSIQLLVYTSTRSLNGNLDTSPPRPMAMIYILRRCVESKISYVGLFRLGFAPCPARLGLYFHSR